MTIFLTSTACLVVFCAALRHAKNKPTGKTAKALVFLASFELPFNKRPGE